MSEASRIIFFSISRYTLEPVPRCLHGYRNLPTIPGWKRASCRREEGGKEEGCCRFLSSPSSRSWYRQWYGWSFRYMITFGHRHDRPGLLHVTAMTSQSQGPAHVRCMWRRRSGQTSGACGDAGPSVRRCLAGGVAFPTRPRSFAAFWMVWLEGKKVCGGWPAWHTVPCAGECWLG